MTLDEWAAEQCGVVPDSQRKGYYWVGGYGDSSIKWTLQDARCREIVREYYGITTKYTPPNEYGWIATPNEIRWFASGGEEDRLAGMGKTIAETECACIQAIYEATTNEKA